MSFSGSLFFARSDAPLTELLAPFTDEAEVAATYEGGWQLARVFGSLQEDVALARLHELTGAPVLAGHVLDSDYVELVVLDTSEWSTTLCRDAARSYAAAYFEEAEGLDGDALDAAVESTLGMPSAEAADALTGWAYQAGCTADPEAVLEVLESGADQAEDLIWDLVERLGFERV